MFTGLKGTHVHFNLTPIIIYEPAELTDDLREYRRDTFLRKKADAIRLERLLSPILSMEHRLKIYQKMKAYELIASTT
jgi:hypothetical protein